MKAVALLLCVASSLIAQSPTSVIRRHDQRRADARRAVQEAMSAERVGAMPRPRRGTVAVIAGRVEGADIRGLGPGLADLLIADLARMHALRLVERMQAQAIVREVALGATDERGRPRAWHLLGAGDIVVVDVRQSGTMLQMTARVVDVTNRRVEATVAQSGAVANLFSLARGLTSDILRVLGVEPTAAERRALTDRPLVSLDAFLSYAAAMDALEGGDAPQADRLLRRAMDLDVGINAAFDASQLAAAGLATSLGGIVPVPGWSSDAGEDPTEAGLATEGNESEYGEAWFEGTGDRSLSLYELAVPLSTSLPLGRGRLDLSTLWASNRADTPANDVFHAWGFTDVHARYTQPLGASGLSLTVGGAFPSRDAHGADDDIRRVPISPDLLPSAMYRRRNAPSLSGGLYFTRPAGAWSWGAAGGAEWSASYHEATPSLHTVAVAPGVRWRVRADATRPIGVGRLAVASSLMALSPATRAGTSLRGGSRTMVRASYARPAGNTDLEAGAWMLHATPVQSAGASLRPASTISAAFATTRSHWRAWTLDAGIELKRQVAGAGNAADLVVPQFTATHPLGRVVLGELGVDYVTGHFHDAPSTRDIPVTGWMLRAGVRVEP
jgi:predicted nucleic acid-binding protein